MGYVVETDVDRFGYLHGGTNSGLALTTAEHSWTTPFPVITGELELVWEPGSVHRRPSVFHHNLLRDFACDLPTWLGLLGGYLSTLPFPSSGICRKAFCSRRNVSTIEKAEVRQQVAGCDLAVHGVALEGDYS